ncbi:hypothetical protein L1887_39336 [Cichorium endivia]|nr:hypothetical protein L1887_39336 [Cichorium endivia]
MWCPLINDIPDNQSFKRNLICKDPRKKKNPSFSFLSPSSSHRLFPYPTSSPAILPAVGVASPPSSSLPCLCLCPPARLLAPAAALAAGG